MKPTTVITPFVALTIGLSLAAPAGAQEEPKAPAEPTEPAEQPAEDPAEDPAEPAEEAKGPIEARLAPGNEVEVLAKLPELPDACRVFVELWFAQNKLAQRTARVKAGEVRASFAQGERPFAAGWYDVRVLFRADRQSSRVKKALEDAGAVPGEDGRAEWKHQFPVGNAVEHAEQQKECKDHYRALIDRTKELVGEVIDAYMGATKARFSSRAKPTREEQVAWAEWVRDEMSALLGAAVQQKDARRRAQAWLDDRQFFNGGDFVIDRWRTWIRDRFLAQLEEISVLQRAYEERYVVTPKPVAARDAVTLLARVRGLAARANADLELFAGPSQPDPAPAPGAEGEGGEKKPAPRIGPRAGSGLDVEDTVPTVNSAIVQLIRAIETDVGLELSIPLPKAPEKGSAAGRKPR